MFFEELSGMVDLSHLNHLTPPRDDELNRKLRRKRVEAITCKRGRVCSGTPPCPCKPVQLLTLDEWQRRMSAQSVALRAAIHEIAHGEWDLSPVLIMDGRHRMAAIAALAGKEGA